MRPIVVAAGGTGGHFFPAEALAATLVERGHRVVLMTDARTGARLGPVFSGTEVHVLQGEGIAGRGFLRGGRALVSLTAGTVQARGILARLGAAAIVGFGGYPSVPPVLAARSLRHRPVIILHEQNAVLGRANRALAWGADLIALGFANTASLPSRTPSILVGNPVRPAIAALRGMPYQVAEDRIELLVLGGSLGARVFGDVVPTAVARLPEQLRRRLHVVQQCRGEDLDRVRAAYDSAGIDAELDSFFADVGARLAVARLVISRAGASTCAEIAVAGRPAILVPLPGAIDDHQAANARALAGACVIAQTNFTASNLTDHLIDMFSAPDLLLAAARRNAACGYPQAAANLADAIERLIAPVKVTP